MHSVQDKSCISQNSLYLNMWNFLPSSSPGRYMKYTHIHTHTPENYNLIPLLHSKPQQICAFIFLIWHLIFTYLISKLGFPDSSAGKESTCNAGDPGLGVGKIPWEGIGYPLQYSWASLVAPMVKNPPAMWETWVQFLGWEDALEEGMATHSSILAWRIPMDRGAWQATAQRVAKSRIQLSDEA